MDDDAFGKVSDPSIQGEIHGLGKHRGLRASGQSLRRFFARSFAVTELNFVEVKPQVVAFAREAQKKFLQRKVMKDDHTATFLHRFKNAGVIAMVVPHVVNDCIELFEKKLIEHGVADEPALEKVHADAKLEADAAVAAAMREPKPKPQDVERFTYAPSPVDAVYPEDYTGLPAMKRS